MDWDSVVYVNGQEVGKHRGGHDAVSLDITDALKANGSQMRAAVELALGRFVMEAFQPAPPVRLAELGEVAVPAAALLLARQSVR